MANEQVIRSWDDAPSVLAENAATTAVRSVSQDRPHGRVVPIDNLKAVLVAWVIAGHALLGYAANRWMALRRGNRGDAAQGA
jgi:hypothetical protein